MTGKNQEMESHYELPFGIFIYFDISYKFWGLTGILLIIFLYRAKETCRSMYP
jgi:hypothetical protein